MKVALFLRVSTSGQTTDNQEKELRELCERREFEIVEVYKETVSGTKKNEDRIEFSRMIKDMRLRKFKKIVVYSIDRLGRDMKELVKTLSLLDDYNISLFSHQQNLDTDDSMSKMFFYFVSIFSEFENNIRKDRQALGIERLRSMVVMISFLMILKIKLLI
ncbi:recombinase family protein [Alphaproteobacteria bacterium]|nr:recombinase family protein [Alphaproteobacteria bacterium]